MTKIIKRTSLSVLALSTFCCGSSALSSAGTETDALRDAVNVGGIFEHLETLQYIADDNDGNRASGLPGFDVSAEYIAEQLLDAGYQVSVQEFEFPFFEELSDPVLAQVLPEAILYPPNDPAGFFTMQYSGSDDVATLAEPVDLMIPPGVDPDSSTSGCELEDFDGFTPGAIALIQRGSCSFLTKALNAQESGATGVVIFNEGQEGRTDAFLGTLQEPIFDFPVVGAAYTVGEELYYAYQAGEVTAHMFVDALSEFRATSNVIGETLAGRDDRVVVVGAHLDSVTAGPGIDDNGSGVATILEIALQLYNLDVEPVNKVRFAFWGAEESGLWGSQFYLESLHERDLKKISLNLNFDMIGSPNYVRFVYDGDGSETELAGPNGSAVIEKVFLDYFSEQDLQVEPTPFDGRSDYGSFIDVGIPAGGLFTGADGIKTEEQEAIYGGIAGEPYDPYYHTVNDDLSNISEDALEQMSDAAAHAILTFAMTKSVVKDSARVPSIAQEAMRHRASRLLK